MSQVLEKPILLDETGQEIVEKLDDIKEAIGVSGDFTPVMIKVTTPPAKIAYMAGEPLDLAGIVVSLIAANGVHIDVTDQCTFNPANGTTLTSADTSVAISYYWYKDDVTFTTSLAIGVKQLASISITTPPTQTEYMIGEELDLTGIVVVATYDDSTFLDVTSRCTFSPADGTVLSINDNTITATYTEGGITKTATQAIEVIGIYGAEWDGTATSAWTRTDAAASFTDPIPAVNNGNGSSPFDDIMPWSGIERVEDTNAGTLVKIPKFWYKWTRDGAKMKLQITSTSREGFLVSPAHADRGDGEGERDYVYVGAYHCATSTYKSTTGVLPANNITRANFRTNIHNLGSTIWQWDFAMYWTICMLYLVEFADWDSQAKIGYGGSDAGSIQNSGLCDSMTYHTGTNAANVNAQGHIRYRWIEDLWANVSDYCDGIYFDNYNILCIMNPADFSDSAGGTLVGIRTSTRAGTISEYTNPSVLGYEYALYASSTGVSNTEYVCDREYYSNTGTTLNVGGAYNPNVFYGLFCLNGSYGDSFTDISVGSRLMKLPNS